MTNEQIVSEIRNGYSVTDYMQLLYESNLPLIKKFIKPYAAYEPVEDLVQESYFGLWEAVQHYETSANVRFMTYVEYWIRQSVQRYLEKCGSTVRIPSHTRQKIARYKKTVQELEQELGRMPTDNEISDKMRVPVGLLPELKIQMQGVASLDTPWNRQPGSLSAENGAGRVCGKAGFAGAEGAGVPDALFQQQLKPADP